MRKSGLVLLFYCVVTTACQKNESECPAGTEDCRCFDDGTCDEGLVCELEVCVPENGNGDAGTDDADSDPDDTVSGETCEYECSAHCASVGGVVMSGTCAEEDDQCCDMSGEGDTNDDSDVEYEISLRVPITTDIFTADPSAHVFDDTLYVYPSHDQDTANGYFYMLDYHVFSLEEDGGFTDHGEILNVDDVAWATSDMWAPDAAYKDGTYFFYFPAKNRQGIFQIGVATSASPTGPFTPESTPIDGSFSIDPAVFIDDDGKTYMYFGGLWGGQLECWKSGSYDSSCQGPYTWEPALGPRVARLDSSMKAIDGEVEEITIVDGNGDALTASDESRRFFEGVWMHKYNDTYYLSYSTGTTHLIVYATGDAPTGTFTYRGLLLPNHDSGWTTHHSVVQYHEAWYLFYHDATCSGGIGERRCVKVADLHYNADGTIQTVHL